MEKLGGIDVKFEIHWSLIAAVLVLLLFFWTGGQPQAQPVAVPPKPQSPKRTETNPMSLEEMDQEVLESMGLRRDD